MTSLQRVRMVTPPGMGKMIYSYNGKGKGNACKENYWAVELNITKDNTIKTKFCT